MIARVIAALAVVAACGATPARAAPNRVRVMTYNVNFGLAGDPAAVAAITAGAADIVLLQETDATWAAFLVEHLGARYPHHAFAPPGERWAARGMGILSRWPIRAHAEHHSAFGPFFAWRLIVDAPGGPIQLLDVHLHPPISARGSWLAGYFTTRGVREREARDHVAVLAPEIPTIVAGDFNEEDRGRALAVFGAHGFTNALPRTQAAATTWRWPVGPMTLRMRLDHILHDRRFRLIDARVVDGGRSDHLPVWAELERVDLGVARARGS